MRMHGFKMRNIWLLKIWTYACMNNLTQTNFHTQLNSLKCEEGANFNLVNNDFEVHYSFHKLDLHFYEISLNFNQNFS
jgi:hypothetical protein